MNAFRSFIKKYTGILIVVAFFAVIGWAFFAFFHTRMDLLTDPNALKDLLESFEPYSAVGFLGLQVLQVVIFIIPGEIFQIVGGFVFGPFLGFFLCLAGSVLGGTINFYFARLVGRKRVEQWVGHKDGWLFEKINEFNESKGYEKKVSKLIFLLYLIPGMPKDLLGYICGVTEIRFVHYIIFSNLGKLPALFLSTFFGDRIGVLPWWVLALIAFVVIIIFLLGIMRSKHFFSSHKNKKNTM